MSNRPAVPEAKIALNQFKMEIAHELGIEDQTAEHGYLGDITAKQAGEMGNTRGGNIGGEMVRRMIELAEKNMIQKNK